MKSVLRSIKSVFGWVMAILFGMTAVYSVFDGVQDDFAVVLVCFLLAAVGVLLILSARREKKKLELDAREEKQYQRRQSEEERAQVQRERAEAIPYVAVECPGCGAVARVRKGGAARCEYCGSVLSGK